ncbi:hypothetical protein [Stenotrophomonas maltophilia]
MTGPLLAFPLFTGAVGVAVAVTTSIGAARIVSWLLHRRDHTASQRSREAQVIAFAQAEIAATTRGDLLGAARIAEQQEARRA